MAPILSSLEGEERTPELRAPVTRPASERVVPGQRQFQGIARIDVRRVLRVMRGCPSGTFKVLLALAAHCDFITGGDAWPAVQTLAELALVSKRTAQRALRSLESLQVIEKRPNHIPGRPPVYRILIMAPHAQGDKATPSPGWQSAPVRDGRALSSKGWRIGTELGGKALPPNPTRIPSKNSSDQYAGEGAPKKGTSPAGPNVSQTSDRARQLAALENRIEHERHAADQALETASPTQIAAWRKEAERRAERVPQHMRGLMIKATLRQLASGGSENTGVALFAAQTTIQ
jgi:hypothetical protein